MKTFNKIATLDTIASKEKEIKIQIVKYQKEGTSRFFFVPEIDGKRLNRTLYARKYDAVRLAALYISRA